MPYRLDPGSSGAVLLVCLVFFPAILLVLRRKWRLAEARRAEVIRLVRLAAAEAERAERENATFASGEELLGTPLAEGGLGMSTCAVCQRPTTNRCARCKIVKYCSGKCQIIHWRQGHRDECHAAPVDLTKSQPHAAPVDLTKSQPHVLDMNGGQDERSEIAGNETETKFHSHKNEDRRSTYGGLPTKDEEHAEDVFFGNRRSASERELDGIGSPETSSNKSVQLKSNHSSEVYSEIGNIRHKSSSNSLGKGEFTASITGSLVSTGSALLGAEEMTDDFSPNEVHMKAETGLHFNTNPSSISFDDAGKPFFNRSLKSSKTSIVGSQHVKLPLLSPKIATANSFDIASSNHSKPQRTHVNEKTEWKSNTLSSGKSYTSDRDLDARLYQKDIESMPDGSFSKTISRSEISKCYEYKETTVRVVKSDDCTESQSCCNSNHSQLDAKPLSARTVKLPTPKSFCPVSVPVKHEPTDIKSRGIGKPYEEKSIERLKHLSPSLGSHSSSLVDSPINPRNVSLAENTHSLPTKSVNISGPLLKNKVLVRGDVKKNSSYLSTRLVQQGVFGCESIKHDDKMFFPYELFIKLCNSNKVALHPCGLINCGNSCYANAALQCLAFTRPLAAYLLEGLHDKTCPKKGWCFTCAFGTLLMKANQGNSPLSPIGIISHIRDIGSNFSQGMEEDAHEFLRHAIDAMQSACLKEAGSNATGDLAQETTLIHLMFGGYLHSKIKCLRCKYKSERRERMMDLTVEMHGDIETLEEALTRFTAAEILEGENKYKCDRCKTYEHAKKHLTILEAPNVLTIALKRYQSGRFGKLNKIVRFPEYLNLAPYMRDSDDKSPVYRLYAVVVHKDVMNATFSGHYICFVKNSLGKWFKADDSVVKQVEIQTVLSQGAYMLLYSRCSPRAPSLLRKEMAKKSRLKQSIDSHSHKLRSSSIFSQLGLSESHRTNNRNSHNHVPSNSRPHDLSNDRVCRSTLDISSDSSSLFSCSDEGSSWSVESTKDSATSEDFTESVFGERGRISCDSPMRFSDESGSTYSPNSRGQMSESPDLSPLSSRMDEEIERGGEDGFQVQRNLPFFTLLISLGI